jgi:hypothetical protein
MFIASKAPWRLSLAYISRMSGIDAILSQRPFRASTYSPHGDAVAHVSVIMMSQ